MWSELIVYISAIGILPPQIFCGEFPGDKHLLSRKRRYVTFPEGSSVGVQSVLSKPFLDYNFPSNWNWGVEYQVSFKLPNDTLQNLERMFRHRHEYVEVHRRDRRHVYQQLEAILDLNGVNGKACVLRTLCEAKFLLSPGKSLWQDLLHILFRLPAGAQDSADSGPSYDAAASHQDCQPWSSACPVSILGFLLATASSLPAAATMLPFLGQ